MSGHLGYPEADIPIPEFPPYGLSLGHQLDRRGPCLRTHAQLHLNQGQHVLDDVQQTALLVDVVQQVWQEIVALAPRGHYCCRGQVVVTYSRTGQQSA